MEWCLYRSSPILLLKKLIALTPIVKVIYAIKIGIRRAIFYFDLVGFIINYCVRFN